MRTVDNSTPDKLKGNLHYFETNSYKLIHNNDQLVLHVSDMAGNSINEITINESNFEKYFTSPPVMITRKKDDVKEEDIDSWSKFLKLIRKKDIGLTVNKRNNGFEICLGSYEPIEQETKAMTRTTINPHETGFQHFSYSLSPTFTYTLPDYYKTITATFYLNDKFEPVRSRPGESRFEIFNNVRNSLPDSIRRYFTMNGEYYVGAYDAENDTYVVQVVKMK